MSGEAAALFEPPSIHCRRLRDIFFALVHCRCHAIMSPARHAILDAAAADRLRVHVTRLFRLFAAAGSNLLTEVAADSFFHCHTLMPRPRSSKIIFHHMPDDAFSFRV